MLEAEKHEAAVMRRGRGAQAPRHRLELIRWQRRLSRPGLARRVERVDGIAANLVVHVDAAAEHEEAPVHLQHQRIDALFGHRRAHAPRAAREVERLHIVGGDLFATPHLRGADDVDDSVQPADGDDARVRSEAERRRRDVDPVPVVAEPMALQAIDLRPVGGQLVLAQQRDDERVSERLRRYVAHLTDVHGPPLVRFQTERVAVSRRLGRFEVDELVPYDHRRAVVDAGLARAAAPASAVQYEAIIAPQRVLVDVARKHERALVHELSHGAKRPRVAEFVPRAADPRRRDDVDEREDGEAARHELVGQVVEQTARRGRFAAQCPALIVLGLGREQSQSAPREDAADPRLNKDHAAAEESADGFGHQEVGLPEISLVVPTHS
mmetsp:Transcript_33952/g.104237  ORF Transcript_33952/g.104237 Transcript_33952/m.104237 type:complete len:382 (+) Transcript_33952:278-1423(+)